jgi:transcriptional antiterminator RfaH
MSGSSFAEQASWYVVQTKPRQEFRALEQLQNQHYTCFLPTLEIERVRGYKLQTIIEPLFTRYLFIRLDGVTCNWAPIRSTRGVSKLVAFGARFATLPEVCIEAMRRSPQSTHQRLFEPGDRVAITSGPFAGLEGIYQLSDGEARALVLIELMSQPQKLKFAVQLLRKAA